MYGFPCGNLPGNVIAVLSGICYAGVFMFAMRNRDSGETVAMSRWAADATLPSLDRTATENYAYVDPASRFFDTFGAYEIQEIEKLPPEERKKRNRIYER